MTRGERVLFVDPTRRLAQNLLAGLAENLTRDHGWPKEVAFQKLALWSSDAGCEPKNSIDIMFRSVFQEFPAEGQARYSQARYFSPP